jgi:hypothetical protein
LGISKTADLTAAVRSAVRNLPFSYFGSQTAIGKHRSSVLGAVTTVTSHQVVSSLCSLAGLFLGVAIFVGDAHIPLDAGGVENIIDPIDDRLIAARGRVEHQVNPWVWGWSGVSSFSGNARLIFRVCGVFLIHDINHPFLFINPIISKVGLMLCSISLVLFNH